MEIEPAGIHSFRSYGKVDEADDREFRRSVRWRLIITTCVSLALLLLVIAAGVVVGVVLRRSSKSTSAPPATTPLADLLTTVCSVTLHPNSCVAAIREVMGANTTTHDPEELFKLSLRAAVDTLAGVVVLPRELASGLNDTRAKAALQVCSKLIGDSIDQLSDSLGLMQRRPGKEKPVIIPATVNDIRTWLSAALANQATCLDGFSNTTGGYREMLRTALRNSTELISNSLAIATSILDILRTFDVSLHRKLLFVDNTPQWTPEWVASDTTRRRLLLSGRWTPDVTVAKDGSGQFKTIADALAAVPRRSSDTFVIYVKGGRYVERVVVESDMWNVVMIGDGMDKTVVSGARSFADGIPTYFTATFAVEGKGFMAMYMRFENTAGPAKQQAVALMSKADHSIFYRCLFDGYQDTLYVHSLRQFYLECEVRGTVDFIFGDAAAVLQKCAIRPRQPLPGQKNAITAQGRSDPNENTGISIQGCTVSPSGKVTAQTFLGRPWFPYATAVFLKTEIGGVVDPKGWLPWDGQPVPPPTIFLGEYMNYGPGSSTARRVNWAGYRPAMTSQEARRFSVNSFIDGSTWIPKAKIAYAENL